MKRMNLILTVLLTATLTATVVKAQDFTASINENAVKNLISGINSDNSGLKRSCIYLAGKYRLSETIDKLVECLQEEEDAGTRILISISLYEIRDPKGLEAVKELSLKDNDESVRKISGLIFQEYVKNSNYGYVTNGTVN